MRFLRRDDVLAFILVLPVVLVACTGGGDMTGASGDGGRDGNVGDAGGDDAGDEALVCSGTATLCAARPIARCGAGAGCVESGACEELPRTCTNLPADVCATVPGCAWFDLVGRCGLTFLDCTLGQDPNTCEAIAGCTWLRRCVGSPLACDRFSTGQCLDQDGCSLDPDTGFAR